MTDFKPILLELHDSLNILRERESKYGGNAPVELINQLKDYQRAIALTEQAYRGHLSQADWRKRMRPLMVTIRDRGQTHKICQVTIGDVGGDIEQSNIAGRDIIYNITYNIDSLEPGSSLPSPPGPAPLPRPITAPSTPRRLGLSWLGLVMGGVGIVLLVGLVVAGLVLWSSIPPQKMVGDGLPIVVAGFTEMGSTAESAMGTELAQAVAGELQAQFNEQQPGLALVWGPEQLQANGHSLFIGGQNPAELEIAARQLISDTGAALVVYGAIAENQQITPRFMLSIKRFESIDEFNELIGERGIGRPLTLSLSGDHGQNQEFLRQLRANVEILVHIIQGLLNFYSEAPDYQAALTSFEQAAAIESWPSEQGKYVLYTMLGNVAGRIADEYRFKDETSQTQHYYEQANKYYRQAESILVAHELEFPAVYLGLGDSYYHLALMLADGQHLQRAIENYNKAIAATEQTARQTPNLAINARYGLAECYVASGKIDDAFNLFTQVIQDFGNGTRLDLKERAGESNARRGAIYYNYYNNIHCALQEYEIALKRVRTTNKNRASYEENIKALKAMGADETRCETKQGDLKQ